MRGPPRLLSRGSCVFLEELRSSCFSAGAAARCGGSSPPLGRSHSSAGGTGGLQGRHSTSPGERVPPRGEGTPGGDNPHRTAAAQHPPYPMPPSVAKPPTTLPSSHSLPLLPKTGGLQHRGCCHSGKLRQTPQILLPPPQPGLGGVWELLGAHQLLVLLPEVAEQPRAAQPVAGGHCVVGELGDRRGGGPRWGSLPSSIPPPTTALQPSLRWSQPWDGAQPELPRALRGEGTPQPRSPSTSSER